MEKRVSWWRRRRCASQEYQFADSAGKVLPAMYSHVVVVYTGYRCGVIFNGAIGLTPGKRIARNFEFEMQPKTTLLLANPTRCNYNLATRDLCTFTRVYIKRIGQLFIPGGPVPAGT